MDRKNIIILGFAIVAIGLFVIPSTMSMFVGQHRWYSVRTMDDQYDMCSRCHAAEVGEWEANTGAHAAYRAWCIEESSTGVDPGCFCHQINDTQLARFGFSDEVEDYGFEVFNNTGTLNLTRVSWETAWRNDTTPHAAITINCEDCHYNATAQLTAEGAAHKQFYNVAKNATVGSGSGSNNTACLACHTMVGLNITIERIESGITVWANHTNYTVGNAWNVIVSINETERSNESEYYLPNASYPPTP